MGLTASAILANIKETATRNNVIVRLHENYIIKPHLFHLDKLIELLDKGPD